MGTDDIVSVATNPLSTAVTANESSAACNGTTNYSLGMNGDIASTIMEPVEKNGDLSISVVNGNVAAANDDIRITENPLEV